MMAVNNAGLSVSEYIIERVKLDTGREPPYLFPGNRWGWLPDLCNECGFQEGAEIGVSGGRFTERMCQTVPGLRMYAVDPWERYGHYTASQWRFDNAYRRAVERLESLNCEIIREHSCEAVKRFEDSSLDFVYIDANRAYQNVLFDLGAWTPKVRPGGIISGCCYYNEREHGRVKDAVDAFTAGHRIDPWFVLVHHRYPVYLWERT
jgi:predicted O-methyltransferase YrrM